jgi:hypothetical protein
MTHFTHDTTLLHYCASMPPRIGQRGLRRGGGIPMAGDGLGVVGAQSGWQQTSRRRRGLTSGRKRRAGVGVGGAQRVGGGGPAPVVGGRPAA